MSNFDNNRKRKEQDESREEKARETLCKTLHDLAKATYTVMVLGNLTTLFGLADIPILQSVISIIAGSITSYLFIHIGNKIIRRK